MTSQYFQNESPSSLATPEPRSAHQKFQRRHAVAIQPPALPTVGHGAASLVGPQDGHRPRLAAQMEVPNRKKMCPTGRNLRHSALGNCCPRRAMDSLPSPLLPPLPQKYGWYRAGCWGPPSPAACLSSFPRSSRSTSHWRSGLKPGSLHKPHTEQKWCGICLAQVGSGWPRAAWLAGISQ